ncbi:MAG TPA: glycosyltransferase family 4 protein [Planctomycetota bacterium]|nr:glycosyltransferase family 4 protein [Planctomycetota bacterium]
MRVLALSHPVTVPSVRFRFLPVFPLLERRGIEVERVDFPDGFWDRMRLFRRAADFDAVIHVKRLFANWQFGRLRRRSKRLVYDFDDPMIYNKRDGKITLSGTRVSRFRRVLGAADAVVTHNPGFGDLAREYGARRVEIIPMSADLTRYTPRPEGGAGTVVGWLGTASNLPNLLDIAPALQGRTLRIVADRALEIPGVRTEFVPWTLEAEPAELHRFDIAIAPIPADPWAVGKLPMKLIHYMAVGLPVIASGQGSIPTLIRHGENGLLAGSVEEWREALDRLTADADLRARLGRAARRTIETGYTLEGAADKWAKVLTGG